MMPSSRRAALKIRRAAFDDPVVAVLTTRAVRRSVPAPRPSGRPPARTRVGRVLGSYRLVTELGQGGMGTVYYAEHVVLSNRRVAVKVLNDDGARDPEQVERFFDEARAANRIGHPGIVDVIDLGTERGAHYLVMELLEGETLGARIERVKRLAPADVVTILAQACDALAAAHERGIVHRDLKPENLFLARTPTGERVKILDFGIAKLMGSADVQRTRTGLVIGTPTYMSPEQCVGDRNLDTRSDVYSLGVVGYEMLAGRPPFVSDSIGRLIVAHSHDVPPRFDAIGASVPIALAEVVMLTLGKRREDRFASMRELRRALEAAVVAKPPAHLALVQESKRSAPTVEDVERIEAAQTRTVGSRLRDIIHARLQEDRLPLPSMPLVIMRALELLRDDAVGLDRVARTLETDPLVVPAVLKLANSVAFAGAMPVRSIEVAVARLGVRHLRTLLTERAARDVFVSRDPMIARAFRKLWDHCSAVGALSRSLAAAGSVSPDEAYLGGLLHDVGKPVVGVLLLETERSLWNKLGAPAMGGSLWMKIVEDCHAEVGAALAKKWSLPAAVIAAIGAAPSSDASTRELGPWIAYGHALAETVGLTAGLPIAADAEDALALARDRVGGTVVREQAALAALRDVNGR